MQGETVGRGENCIRPSIEPGLSLLAEQQTHDFRTALYEMSSDYFPSNEEPWWSSADARAVSVAADPARKQRLPPLG